MTLKRDADRLAIEQCLWWASETYGVSVPDIIGKSRSKQIVLARHAGILRAITEMRARRTSMWGVHKLVGRVFCRSQEGVRYVFNGGKLSTEYKRSTSRACARSGVNAAGTQQLVV